MDYRNNRVGYDNRGPTGVAGNYYNQEQRPIREGRSVSGPTMNSSSQSYAGQPQQSSQPYSGQSLSQSYSNYQPSQQSYSEQSYDRLSSSQRSTGPASSSNGFYGNPNTNLTQVLGSYRQPSPGFRAPSPYQPDLSSLSISNPNRRTNSVDSRRNLNSSISYTGTSKEDRPPYKLSVSYPDLNILGSMREVALAGEPEVKIAWAKQVLKFIERHQATAGASSRISNPTLVKFCDEALNYILLFASTPNPLPLALFLRGDLSSSGSFPSYRAKDSKLAFRDFEAASIGYKKSWFRLGKAYEDYRDLSRALNMYQTGVEKEDCACFYRMGMVYLLGQLGLERDLVKALHFLEQATTRSDLDTPQPGFVLGMVRAGEFDGVVIPVELIDVAVAKESIEKAAFLGFGPAQYKMGQCYEHATLDCAFDPLLSVQYYALASQNGEVEADLALSKWYLCGSIGNFDKNEGLAVTFAEKAAKRGLASAEFALGYYREVGIGSNKDLAEARSWYARAAKHGSQDATDRLSALSISEANTISISDHESHIDARLTRKRSQAANVSEERRKSLRQPPNSTTDLRRQSTARAVERAAFTGGTSMISGGASGSGGSGRSINGSTRESRRTPPPQEFVRDDAFRSPPRSTSRQQYSQQSPPSTAPQFNNPNPTSPPRNQQYSSSTNPQSPNYPPTTHSQGRSVSQPQQQQPQKVYQLSDNPTPTSTTTPLSSIPAPKRENTYASFAEMGVSTQKAKGDECLIM